MTSSKFEKLPFNKEQLLTEVPRTEYLTNWPVVYTVFNRASKQIYIGETTNAISRLVQHTSSISKANLSEAQVIVNPSFNKSVCLDLESQLIRFFDADGTFQVINSNGGISDADYFDRANYQKTFDGILEELHAAGLLQQEVKTLINSEFFKYSPFKSLNFEQAAALNEVLENFLPNSKAKKGQTYVIQGDPGTGKTIVAIYLVKLLHEITVATDEDLLESESIFSDFFVAENRRNLAKTKIGLVIPQQSLRKTIQRVFDRTPGLSPRDVLSPFDAAASDEIYDLLIVDEAHRLQQRSNQSSAQQNKQFTDLNLKLFKEDDKSKTQLDWIKARSNNQILLIDAKQTVKPADLSPETMKSLVSEAKVRNVYFQLVSQMRLQAGGDYIDYVGDVFAGLNPIPKRDFGDYDVKFFESFSEMFSKIKERELESTLSRLVSGYGWKWTSKGDRSKHDFEIEGHKLAWNRTVVDWVSSATSKDEVGSIHTVQGYDLNFAGVIVGPELKFDTLAQKITFDRSSYFDAKGKQNNPGQVFTDDDLKAFVTNIYRVLMTRGIKGTYIYVVDPELRKYLSQFFPKA